MHMHIQISPQIKQIMTTEMIMQLEILQMNNEELAQLLSDKALENPLLQIEENWQPSTISYTKSKSFQLENVAQGQQKEYVIDQLVEQISLDKQLLRWQRRVLHYLIYNLDERLFLTIDTSEVAQKFAMSEQQINSCIQILQSIGPDGIATKNSVDFLVKQAERDVQAPALAMQFIANEMNAMAKLEIPYLMKTYKLSKEEVLKTLAYVKSLQPYPFCSMMSDAQIITPDLEISWVNNQWEIKMCADQLPNLTLNESYVTLLSNEGTCKVYLDQHLKEARLLISSIAERKKTLFLIVECLLNKQDQFAHNGMQGLKPLRLIDVAQELQLHESTISRAVRHKYIKSPFGLIALKEFFPKGMLCTEHDKISNQIIKERIRHLIEEESSTNPFSDQQLAEFLTHEGIQISRRTVAKYRESLFIPNSVKRMYLC